MGVFTVEDIQRANEIYMAMTDEERKKVRIKKNYDIPDDLVKRCWAKAMKNISKRE